MENYDFNKLAIEGPDYTHITHKIEMAVERTANFMMSKSETGIYDGDVPVDDGWMEIAFDYDDEEDAALQQKEYNQELNDMLEYKVDDSTIVDNDLQIVLYHVDAFDFAFVARVGTEVINEAIYRINQAVEEEIEDGCVPVSEKENTIKNALRCMCEVINFDAKEFFDGAMRSDVETVRSMM